MNPVFDAAAKRALMGAFISAAVVFFSTLPATDDYKVLASAVGGAFFSYLALRLGVEGAYDMQRAKNGQVNPGDVPEASSKVVVTKVAN